MIAHGTLLVVAARKRLTEELADPAAVGKPGQDIDVGEMGQALLRLANFGNVRADAAEALETPGSVDDRVDRQWKSSEFRVPF